MWIRYYANRRMTILRPQLKKTPTDRQNHLQSKSEHSYLLKKSIAHSQALRIKSIWSEATEYTKQPKALENAHVSKEYHRDSVIK